MSHDVYSDAFLREILTGVKTIAVVGLSNNEMRPSHYVSKYLLDRGYKLTGVNPGLAGQTILGMPVYKQLADIPYKIDLVDIFRKSEAVGGVVDEALAMNPLPQAIWMQLDIRDEEAAQRAEAKGIKVVMNRCPKIECERLLG
jgi:predicted CoA-binding protein